LVHLTGAGLLPFESGMDRIMVIAGPAKLRDSIRFRILRPIRDSIRVDGPIRNFRIVRAVKRHS